jgi:hypothetical protein
LALGASIAELQDWEGDLVERLRKAPPPGDLRMRRRKALVYWCIAGVLTIAAFVFSVLTLDPFRLGWKAWLYSLGIAIVAPFLVDRTLEVHETREATRLVKFATTIACLAALSSLLLLAIVRGHILRQQLQSTTVVQIEDEGAGTPVTREQDGDFYGRTTTLMQMVMALLAIAMEIGAGLAVREAKRWGASGSENPDELRHKLQEVRQQMIAYAHERTVLEKAGAVFEEGFRRDFARSVLNRAKNGTLKRFSAFVLFAALLASIQSVSAQTRVNLVVVPDLTASVASANGLDHKSEMDRNIAAVSKLLAALPAGSRITVLGVTDHSFSQPYVLLSARIDPDEGYFKERVKSARAQLVQAWQKRSSSLVSRFQQTDLLGALVVSGQVFQSEPGTRNVLVVLSDMRHETPGLNFAKPALLPKERVLHQVERARLVANLKGVEVYVLGVDGAGKSVAYWDSLREFWLAYFREAGAELRTYSMLREVPELAK